MEFIEKILGVSVFREKWDKTRSIPYYLSARYDIEKVLIDKYPCLFIIPLNGMDAVSSIKKHIIKIQELENISVVLELENISHHRMQSFIEEKIPFVVSGKLLYLPFIGAYIQERFSSVAKHIEKIQPSTQMLFLYFIYNKAKLLYANLAIEKLGFSAMTITRAVRQLEQTGLVTVTKNGVNKIIASDLARRELFEKAKPYLINPIRKKVYIAKSDLNAQMVKAGILALSEMSMLNPSLLDTYAIESQYASGLKISDELIDAQNQLELELWKYNPLIFGSNGCVDPLSLCMTLSDDTDERVELMIEELLNKLWEDIDGTRI